MSSRKTLAGAIGFLAAGLATVTVAHWEGERRTPYLDVGGIPTVCFGDTKDVEMGRTYSAAECEERLERQLIAHAEPVLACVPQLRGRPYQTAAAVSLAYNIGTGAFCKSTLAGHFRAGRWREGCDGFLAWRYAGGREVQGLLNRRREERALCLRGL